MRFKLIMVVINNPYIILIVNIVVGFILIFLFPLLIKFLIKFWTNIGISKMKIGQIGIRCWELVLSKKLIQMFGILWVIVSLFIFIFKVI